MKKQKGNGSFHLKAAVFTFVPESKCYGTWPEQKIAMARIISCGDFGRTPLSSVSQIG